MLEYVVIEQTKYIRNTLNISDDYVVLLFPEIPTWLTCSRDAVSELEEVKNEYRNKESIFLYEYLKNRGVFGDTDNQPILRKNESTLQPLALMIEATTKCNLQCPYCYNAEFNKRKSSLSFQDFQLVLDSISNLTEKNRKVTISGGEPFLWSKLDKAVKEAIRLGYDVEILTNGTVRNELDVEAEDREKVRFTVSIDGPSEEIHSITRGGKSFNKSINFIKEQINNGFQVSINHVITINNHQFFPEILDLALDLNVSNVFPLTLNYVGAGAICKDGRYPDYRLSRMLYSLVIENDEYKRLLRKSRWGCNFSAVKNGLRANYCGVGNQGIYLTSTGGIYGCPNTVINSLKMKEIQGKSIVEINPNWFKNLSVDTFEVCSECEYRYFCGGGCRGETYLNTGSLYMNSPHCDDYRIFYNELFWFITNSPNLFD